MKRETCRLNEDGQMHFFSQVPRKRPVGPTGFVNNFRSEGRIEKKQLKMLQPCCAAALEGVRICCFFEH